ncbi:MAG: Rne/Rng family ribonuclease [Terriglobia bacterium]
MSKEMIISTSPQETKVAILEDDQLVEVHIERSHEQGLVGSIYKGRVTKVLPGMQSAFVNVGLERDAFLYVSDFFEDAEEYDSIVATVEDKIEKLESSPGDTVTHSPLVIEIPTRLEPSELAGTSPGVPPGGKATPEKIPPLAQAAVLAQPAPVSEKAAETEVRQDMEKGASGPGSAQSTQKNQNDLDRQSRGRYGRRRGRRRPWERRKEEQPRSLPQSPVQGQPSPVPVVVTPPPPPPPVVSTLTPLPGESLSKFQQSQTAPDKAPLQSAELPSFEAVVPGEPAVSAPSDMPEPIQAAPPEVSQVGSKEPVETLPSERAVTAPWAPETPLIPNQPETLEQVEKILSILDVPVEPGQLATTSALTPSPAAPLEEAPLLSLDVTKTEPEGVVSAPLPEPATSRAEIVERTEEPLSMPPPEAGILQEFPPAISPVSADTGGIQPEGPIAHTEMTGALETPQEAVAPFQIGPVVPHGLDTTPEEESKAFPASGILEAPVLEVSAPSPVVAHEILVAEEGEATQVEEQFEEKNLPSVTIPDSEFREMEGDVTPRPASSLATEGTIPEETTPSRLGMEFTGTVVPAPRLYEPSESSEEPVTLAPDQPSVKGTGTAEEAVEAPTPALTLPGTPPEVGFDVEPGKSESLMPETLSGASAVVTEGSTPSMTDASRPQPREETKPPRVGTRFEKPYFSKPSREPRPFEAKGSGRSAQRAFQPEVYGPPTPYEYLTDEEKADFNARRAQEKSSAKILDSSRKLTAPQPRDNSYQRGRRGRRGRSKRFADQESRPEQATPREEKRPTSRPLIAELLREGQEILVQIAKEPLGKKGARITSHIALPGRYLVYMPTVDHIGVSRKISSEEERRRLKRVINEFGEGLPGGFIVRTAGEGRTEEELKQDIRFLANTWADIRSRAEKRAAPALLHRDLGVLERILRDQLSSEFTAIRLDNETEFAKVLEFVNQFQPALVGRVKMHFKDTPIFEEYGVDHEIEKALKPKVWLKSGGYIVINQTEAMVAIDVNTGKFVGRTTRLEDTIVKTNIDAAKEVARQIRLRDMGGIIVIDFIDMEERKNRQKVIQSLEEAMREDRAPSKILSFNDFGLVALTRKRVKQSLEKILMQPCVYCQGHGLVKSLQTVCYEIQSEAKKMAPLLDGREIRIRVHPEVARALKTSEQAVVSEIESHTRKDVTIKPDPQTHQDQFEIF